MEKLTSKLTVRSPSLEKFSRRSSYGSAISKLSLSSNDSPTSKVSKKLKKGASLHVMPQPASPSPLSFNISRRSPSPDPIPTTKSGIEELLNFHTSQLETMRQRLEWVNEHLDRDNIVLFAGRLDDPSKATEKWYMTERVKEAEEYQHGICLKIFHHKQEAQRLKTLLKEMRMAPVGDRKENEKET